MNHSFPPLLIFLLSKQRISTILRELVKHSIQCIYLRACANCVSGVSFTFISMLISFFLERARKKSIVLTMKIWKCSQQKKRDKES